MRYIIKNILNCLALFATLFLISGFTAPKVNKAKWTPTKTSARYNNIIFHATSITQGVTQIQCSDRAAYVYLIEGSKKAVLIDAGIGVGNLRSFVETLTNKPVSVLVTHYHLGGTGGAGDFENVYMHQKDIEWYEKDGGQPLSKRMDSNRPYFESQETWDKFKLEDFPPNKPTEEFLAIEDGATFDLGGTKVIACYVKGHTQGNMAYLVTKQRLLVTGEGVSPNISLLKGDVGLATFEKSLRNLAKTVAGKFDKILISNGDPQPKELIDNLINTCESVRLGKANVEVNKRKSDEAKVNVYDNSTNPQKIGTIKYETALVNE